MYCRFTVLYSIYHVANIVKVKRHYYQCIGLWSCTFLKMLFPYLNGHVSKGHTHRTQDRKAIFTLNSLNVHWWLFSFISIILIIFILNACARAIPQLAMNGCRNTFNLPFAYQYLLPLRHSLGLSLRRTAKKRCNVTDCATSVKFSNSTRTDVIIPDYYTRLFIATIQLTHHMYL